jgi:hypothetical protein
MLQVLYVKIVDRFDDYSLLLQTEIAVGRRRVVTECFFGV